MLVCVIIILVFVRNFSGTPATSGVRSGQVRTARKLLKIRDLDTNYTRCTNSCGPRQIFKPRNTLNKRKWKSQHWAKPLMNTNWSLGFEQERTEETEAVAVNMERQSIRIRRRYFMSCSDFD